MNVDGAGLVLLVLRRLPASRTLDESTNQSIDLDVTVSATAGGVLDVSAALDDRGEVSCRCDKRSLISAIEMNPRRRISGTRDCLQNGVRRRRQVVDAQLAIRSSRRYLEMTVRT